MLKNKKTILENQWLKDEQTRLEHLEEDGIKIKWFNHLIIETQEMREMSLTELINPWIWSYNFA